MDKIEQALKRTRDTWFGQVAKMFHTSQLDQDEWDEIEELLISADVGVSTTEMLIQRLQRRIPNVGVTQRDGLLRLLVQEMEDIFTSEESDNQTVEEASPLILLVVGVNGVGKTTSIAKLAYWYKREGKRVLLGAGDTFRAAAIEQLQSWGCRLAIDVISHQHGADPGAVAFDALQAAKARGADIVIIDTAGRLHNKFNLMEELKKIHRVLSRSSDGGLQQVLLTMDATTGQNGLVQARSFTQAIKCDGIFLTKLDGTAKGGVVLSIAHELKLPIRFVGVGESPEDIASFNPKNFVEALLSPLELN